MSSSSRFPLVLQACLQTFPPSYCVAKHLGILPFYMQTISDPTGPGRGVSLVIGPLEGWFNADRANQQQTDEAWRVLQDEYSLEQIGAMLLTNVPECQGSITIFGEDRNNPWAIGRHPKMSWFWHFKSLFRVLDTTATSTPPPTPTPAPTSATPDPFGDLRRFAQDQLKGHQRRVLEALCVDGELPLETVRMICDWMPPIESAWNSLRCNLNQKLRSHGWQIKTLDHTAKLVNLSAK
jgi:hypothetical protein